MTIYEAANQYLNFCISAQEYRNIAGKDILFIFLDKMVVVNADHVITAISKLLDGSISQQDLVVWINVIWFSDAFEFDESHTDSIVSVVDQLECLDEEGVFFSRSQYLEMINCLTENRMFPCIYT